MASCMAVGALLSWPNWSSFLSKPGSKKIMWNSCHSLIITSSFPHGNIHLRLMCSTLTGNQPWASSSKKTLTLGYFVFRVVISGWQKQPWADEKPSTLRIADQELEHETKTFKETCKWQCYCYFTTFKLNLKNIKQMMDNNHNIDNGVPNTVFELWSILDDVILDLSVTW
jgi:hypothetical protein